MGSLTKQQQPKARKLRRILSHFANNRSGSIALQAALAIPVLMVATGATLDYTNLVSQKASLQAIADTAAVSSARELRTGNGNQTTIQSVASNVVQAALAGTPNAAATTTSAQVLEKNSGVKINLSQTVPSLVGKLMATGSTKITATSTARISGGPAVCILTLNNNSAKALEAQQTALLTGTNCGLYSNSTADNGIIAKGQAKITAKLICSAGGVAGNTKGLSPAPTTDCPPLKDPLASRPPPTVGGCNYTNFVVSGGTQTLNSGVYCGGLHITAGAKAIANPGVFIIKDGPLKVDGDSSLVANNVGFFLTGTDARLEFAAGANTISLSAPITGPLAGLLVFEDPKNKAGVHHLIESDDARKLLGTIYLPKGVLSIGSNAKVADQSAYTVVVADSIILTGGPHMVLNTDYGSTNVPVPEGVGPGAVSLQK